MCNQTQYVQIRGQNILQCCHCCVSSTSTFPESDCLTPAYYYCYARLPPPSLPPSLPPSALARYSSISSIRSSPSREASAETWTALTVPAIGELTTVSIFMAERTHSGWPFSTFHDHKDSSQSIKNTSQVHRPLKKCCSWRLATETHKELDINAA